MPLDNLIMGALTRLIELSPAMAIMAFIAYKQYQMLAGLLDDCWSYILSREIRKDEDTNTG